MSSADPIESLRTDAERAVRRGDLKEGLRLYRELLSRAPADPAARGRLASIESLLQPSELVERLVAPPNPTLDKAQTPEQLAEALFDRGEYAASLATYERILQARPDHQLARERCEEIRHLAHMQGPSPRRSEPADRTSILEGLLVKVATRRR